MVKKKSVMQTENRELDKREFLERLRELFGIQGIYYPGAYDDEVLVGPFKLDEIVALDSDLNAPKKFRRGVHYIVGDYEKAPFRYGFFDALFYQDNHANIEQAIEIIGAVRRGGIIIYSTHHCGDDIGDRAFIHLPGVKRIDVPFSNKYFTVFQKV